MIAQFEVSLGGVSRVAELENILSALIDAFDEGFLMEDPDASLEEFSSAQELFDRAREILECSDDTDEN